MEYKKITSKKKLVSIQEEKLIREFDYNSVKKTSNKELLLDLEIYQKNPDNKKNSQRVLVSVKPKSPAIKTIYIADKTRQINKKTSGRSRSRLALGDHSSINTGISGYGNICLELHHNGSKSKKHSSDIQSNRLFLHKIENSIFSSQNSSSDTCNFYVIKFDSIEKCLINTQPEIKMNIQKFASKTENTAKVDVSTFIVTETTSENTSHGTDDLSSINKLIERINYLERKIIKHDKVFRSLDPSLNFSSSDEELKDTMKASSDISKAEAGCSYIQQYSHIPETSAFHRCAHKVTPLSPSKATTIDKEHNSEQYSRNFTAYDGITARGRRQCASVPCKRNDERPKAAERMFRIRHKLNPVRDYRLMDTVHYLAQGEFAPRDDGIKLTPSREAVLSDIIWEDVFRTHWPNTRLCRRSGRHERLNTRTELQRLIDSLLRERVAHVERRRRRHYRIVKLNHRHESCRPLGKTGDIIVASHKNRDTNNQEIGNSENETSTVVARRHRKEQTVHRVHKSQEYLITPEMRQNRRVSKNDDNCVPGTSYCPPTSEDTTCCYQTSSVIQNKKSRGSRKQYDMTSTSSSSSKSYSRNPRYCVKNKPTQRIARNKDESNLEQYILLPTLVIRTPSNVKRQKKFSELYHRILNEKLKGEDCAVASEAMERNETKDVDKKDIGFNINVTFTTSEENVGEKIIK